MQRKRTENKSAGPDLEYHIKDEIEFARALSALILAARLDEAETRAEAAYRQIIGEGSTTRRRFFV